MQNISLSQTDMNTHTQLLTICLSSQTTAAGVSEDEVGDKERTPASYAGHGTLRVEVTFPHARVRLSTHW